MNEQIIKEQEELKRRGRLYQSEIEGVSDLLWSIALLSVSADKETVKKLVKSLKEECDKVSSELDMAEVTLDWKYIP